MLDEIAAALELGDDLQRGHQRPDLTVAVGERTIELRVQQLLGDSLQRIDGLVAGDERTSHVTVTVEECGGGGGQAVGDHVEQPEDMLVDVCNC